MRSWRALFIWTFGSFLVVGLLLPAAAGAISSAERAALLELYTSTDGANWVNNTGWGGGGGTECDWYGVTCDAARATVTQLVLRQNDLHGTLPTALGDLAGLTKLDLYDNSNSGTDRYLSGTIPSTLGNLTTLQILDLSSGALTGTIPTALGNLSQLDSLYLSGNQLSGSIPVELGNLADLGSLRLYNNQLSGSIPAELGNLTKLDSLYLSSNQLSGSIPAELGNLTDLGLLDLCRNQLTGSIPAELGNLVDLSTLSLGSNQLTGSIPAELGNLVDLGSLFLYNNQLSGSIPSELGNLTQLRQLYLSGNQLSGSIPAELGNLTQLDALRLSGNQLSGSIPVELGNLTQLRELGLSSNQLTGSIPSQFGNFADLRSLCLSNNQLSGSIPVELGNLTQLYYLQLYDNQLSGSIPSEIGNLTQLEYLYLRNNQLSGSIPVELGNLTQLYSLNLFNNQLSGSIPVELSQLHSLWLQGNALEGPLPAELPNLTALVDGQSEFRWNKLWTSDTALRDFLNTKQRFGDWESTQTIPPTNVAVGSPTDTTLTVSWTAIPYTADSGGYRVSYATTSGGSYTTFGTTADKTTTSLTVTGLLPGRTYYFVVQSVTEAHASNANTLVSQASAEASGTASPPALLIPSNIPTSADASVDVPVRLDPDGANLAGIAISIDYDAACLTFDPTDGNGDGLPDAIAFPGVPPGFAKSATFEAADTDGEIDITLHDATPASFPTAGDLVVITFTTSCMPTSGSILAAVGFSAAPAPTFSDAAAHDLPGTWQGGSVEILAGIRGDCNGDGFLSIADVLACELEITDGDGSGWLEVPGGSYAGSPVGCDSNADTVVDAGDVACTIKRYFGGTCTARTSLNGGGRPQVRMPRQPAPRADGTVLVPIDFNAAGHAITSLVFSLDLDAERLAFDPSDADGDGLPDAVRLLGTPLSWRSARFDPTDIDGELDILLADLAAEASTLADGRLFEIELRILDSDVSLGDAVRFAADPAASFGDTAGRSVPGDAVLEETQEAMVFADGFESGELGRWSGVVP